MNGIHRDVAYVLRRWRRTPATAVGALVVLALAFGLSATVFGLVYGVFVRPLPFREPGRLVTVQDMHKTQGYGGASYEGFASWSHDSAAFEATALLSMAESEIQTLDSDEPSRQVIARVTPGFFPMLGVSPAKGRWFLDEEASSGRDRVVILSHEAWRRWFRGGDVLGRGLRLDGSVHTVIGVMPRGFQFNYGAIVGVWAPLAAETLDRTQRRHAAFARMRPDASLAAAQEQLDVLAARYERDAPERNANWGLRVVPMSHASDWIDKPVASALLMAFAVSVVALLIAGTNVTALLLARAFARSREVSVRIALGSSRGRVVRLAIVESTMLAAGGALLGLGVAGLCGQAAVGLLPGYLDLRPEGAGLPMLTFTFGIALLAGLGLGWAPARQMTRRDPAQALRYGAERLRSVGGSRTAMGLLVAGQVAMALALLVNGVALVRGLAEMLTTPLGYRTEGVLVASVRLPAERYGSDPRVVTYFEDLARRVREIPGVVSAAAAEAVPMSGDYSGVPALWEGQVEPTDPRAVRSLVHAVTPGYFRTLGIPLLLGRDFSEQDAATAEPVAIVSEALVRRGGPAQDVIGRRVRVEGEWRTVIGLVGDVRRGPTSERIDDDVYVPHAQRMTASMRLIVHAREDGPAVTATLRAAAQGVDPRSRVREIATMSGWRDAFSSGTRTLAMWVVALAGFGVLLATSGLFGLVAYWVARHRRDDGIRLAIGASPAGIVRASLRRGLRWAGLGMVVGIVLAHASVQIVGRHVLGAQSAGAISYLAALGMVAVATSAACYLPARRAARSNPADVLRA